MAWDPQKKPHHGLPDLEAQLKNFIKSLFKSAKPNPQAPSPHSIWKTWATGLLVLFSMWGISGIYQVQPNEEVILSSFGKLETISPGWHWFARFIQHKYSIDSNQVLTLNLDESLLSQDQAVLSLQFTMQYQVKSAQQYLFNTSNPAIALQQISEAKLTQDVGNMSLANLLQSSANLNQTLQQQIQQLCDQYKLGVNVSSVAVQNVSVPDSVQSVLSSIQNATQNAQNMQAQAQQQVDTAMQTAKAQAAQIIKQAQDQAVQAVPKAQREVAEFLAILPAYQQNPQVTRERMYYDTMQKVYASGRVVVVDANASVNLPSNLWQNTGDVASPAASSSSSALIPVVSKQSASSSQDKLSAYLRWKEAQSNED
ncbi:MAG: HflK protein [Gammaproteobacteria bacterium]|jgi:membrane protease subunit HflK|nr:HflK protein [Gammaproteobacteria bacterium]